MTTFRLIALLGVVSALGLMVAGCGGHGRCSMCSVKSAPKREAKMFKKEAQLNTAALAALVRARTPMVILDARSGQYDDGRRIPGARSLNDQSSAQEVAGLIKSKDELVVTYCANLQCPASHKLAVHLKDLGYANVIEYPLGIQGWAEAGNAVEQAK